MAKRSNYQQRVIKNYYQNRDAIMLQRLGDLISELYLAEGAARGRLWKRVVGALEKLVSLSHCLRVSHHLVTYQLSNDYRHSESQAQC